MTRPTAVLKEPQARRMTREEAENAQEAREKREADIRTQRRATRDEFQKAVDFSSYISECLIPDCQVGGKRVFVSRFYNDLKLKDAKTDPPTVRSLGTVVIDFFETAHEVEQGKPEERFKTFKERGWKYAWLGPQHGSLMAIFDQLAEQ